MTRNSAWLAKIAGVLLLISLVAGGFGELYVPTTVTVPNDAAATARNIDSSNLLFRMGFAAYLVEGLCNIALTLIFYVLLRPVRKDMALLAAFFGLVAVAVFAVAELFYLAPLLIFESRNSLNAFSNDQLDAIALLSLKFYGYASGALMAFGGVGSIIFGCLIFLSGYLPRILGALLALGGLGFVIRNFALVLAPAHAYDWLFLPMSLGMLGLGIWLLIFGGEVDSMEGRAR